MTALDMRDRVLDRAITRGRMQRAMEIIKIQRRALMQCELTTTWWWLGVVHVEPAGYDLHATTAASVALHLPTPIICSTAAGPRERPSFATRHDGMVSGDGLI